MIAGGAPFAAAAPRQIHPRLKKFRLLCFFLAGKSRGIPQNLRLCITER